MELHQTLIGIAGAEGSPTAPASQFTYPSIPPPLERSPEGLGCEQRHLITRVLPDPAICRAQAAGFGEYVDCLVECPYGCPHALSFGFAYLCNHPDRAEIVRRTLARRK